MTDAVDPQVSKPKKNFFKAPAWLEASVKNEKKPDTKQQRDATELFSRSTSSAAEVAAEQRRKAQLKQEKKARAAAKESDIPVVKRRKVSEEGDYSDSADDKNESLSPFKSYKRASASSLQALTKRYEATTPGLGKPATINISDDSNSDSESPPPVQAQHTFNAMKSPRKAQAIPDAIKPNSAVEEHDEDEDFPELARKARQRVREQELERKRAEARAKFETSDLVPVTKTREGPNPVIDIMIISNLEGATPLLVKRKWNQNFKDIRTAWLNLQHALPPTIKSEVYFTWRGKKVYDVASCRSLGIKLDEDGNPLFPSQNTFSDGSERVVLEATTIAQIKAEREAEAEKKRREEEEEDAEYAPKPVAAVQTAADQIRFILKAKGLPDQKLKAKPDTTIERVMGSFRIFHKLDDTVPVVVMLDGDELSPQDTIHDAGVEDMDMLECHVK